MRNLIVLTIVLASAGAGAQTRVDSWIGTWTLNLQKSTYAGSPAPKSGVSRLMPADGGRTRVSQDQVTAQGTERHIEVTVAFDGKDYDVPGLPGVTYAFTRVNDSIYVLVAKEKGVVNPEGKTVANIAVYERQR